MNGIVVIVRNSKKQYLTFRDTDWNNYRLVDIMTGTSFKKNEGFGIQEAVSKL